MKLKLVKTLLSRKPGHPHFLFSLFSLMSLVVLFELNHFNIFPLSKLWSASGSQVFEQGQYWRAFTTTFIHADFNHLTMNTAFFTGLTLLFSTYFGWMFYPIATIVAGGLINLVVLSFYPPQVSLVGISGVIYFMAALWLTFYVLVEKQISLGRRLINSVGLALIFLFPQTIEPQVSYGAHAVGFALGIPTGISYYLVNRVKIKSYEVWIELPEEPLLDFENEENS